MKTTNMAVWATEIMKSGKREALPIMTHPGIEILGKTVREAVTDGAVHAAAVEAVAKRYPAAAATVIMDLTVEAEAFGAEVVFPEDEVPSVVGRLLNNEQDIEALKVPSLTVGRVPEYLRANLLLSRSITDRPVFAGCIGPYSLAGRLYDMSEMMMLICVNPTAARTLLAKCTEFLIHYCLALKACGVQGVIMAEPAAGLLSDDDCRLFSSVFVKEIVERVQDDDFMLVLHNCGNTGQCTHAMVTSGAAAYHFGNKIDMVEALRDCPSNVPVMGNLDPVCVMQQMSPEEVRRETLALMDQAAAYPNFVVSSGCDIPPYTPEANIDAFFEAVKEWNEQHVPQC